MSDKKDERIDDYTDEDVVEEVIETTEIPKQRDFYKIPRRFGSIPVDELPLGCDPQFQYQKIYPRVPLPFQKADRVTFGHPDLEPNRLIWGDNLHVMRMLPSNSIDLIYIDPPFFSSANYTVIFGDQNESRSFSDIWEGGMPSYLIWLNARLIEMKRLLKSTGSIYVHLDYHAVHYVKMEMDKIFGYDQIRGEIIWSNETSSGFKAQANKWIRGHDTILYYTKTNKFTFNKQHNKLDERTIQRYDKVDSKGRKYKIYYAKDRSKRIVYLEKSKGRPVSTVWSDIPSFQTVNNTGEYIGYPTQKPEKVLERIITASSNEGDLVADFCVGGGTTSAVAQKLGRKWIACDQSRVAVAVTQGRLETLYEKSGQQTLAEVPDTSVEYWGTYEIPSLEQLSQDEFVDFIVTAFGGRASTAGETIHGYKRDIPIFVGSAKQDKVITKDNVISFAEEITKTKGKFQGIMLGWSFAQSAKTAVEKLLKEGNPGVDLIQISLTDVDSPKFREHVTKLHSEYESYLKFILPPEVIVNHKRLEPLTYEFDSSESIPLNEGSTIVNVQWDFEYLGRFTPTKGFGYGRDAKAKPLLNVQFKFKRLGKTSIACRVQDDLGGEKIYTEIINVK